MMETLVSKSAVPSEVFVARLARALDRRRHETQLAPGAESPLPSALLAPLPFAEPAPLPCDGPAALPCAEPAPLSSAEPAALPNAEPALRLAIVSCMDARLDINRALRIDTGDAHILRNAGGRITPDVIRSLTLSVRLLKVREVGIVHHTGCGLEGVDNDALADRTGVVGMDFLPFRTVAESLAADVDAVRRSGLLPRHAVVWGARYDLATGELAVVCGPIVVE